MGLSELGWGFGHCGELLLGRGWLGNKVLQMVVLDGHGWLAFYGFVGVWICFGDKFEVYEFVLEISLRG